MRVQRYGSVIKVKSEKLEQYKKLHATVWPDVLAMIKQCNIRNYTIYHKDNLLFSYFEYIGDDYASDMKNGGRSITQKWWDVCKPCQEPIREQGSG